MALAWIKFSEARSVTIFLLAQLHLHTWQGKDTRGHRDDIILILTCGIAVTFQLGDQAAWNTI